MGSYDGAEVCELVGTYMLSLIWEKYKDFGLYRDGGLRVRKNKSGPKTEKIKKTMQKIFSKNKLDIVIQCNMKLVNYLDVTLNLNNSNYKPFQKSGNNISHTHKDSNHSISILKQTHIPIEKRIFTLSSNETIFKESKEMSQKALGNPAIGKLWEITSQTKISATTSKIENEIPFVLSLHLVLMSTQKSEIIYWVL